MNNRISKDKSFYFTNIMTVTVCFLYFADPYMICKLC